jgi:hypothetical protein
VFYRRGIKADCTWVYGRTFNCRALRSIVQGLVMTLPYDVGKAFIFGDKGNLEEGL